MASAAGRTLTADAAAPKAATAATAPAAGAATAATAPPLYDNPAAAAVAAADPQVAAAMMGGTVPATGTPGAATLGGGTRSVELPLTGRPATPQRSVEEVNKDAPSYALPTAAGVVEARPNLAVSSAGAAPASPPTASPAAKVAADLPGDPAVPVAPSYMKPNNPAYREGAPAPALAELVAAAKAAEAPARALAARAPPAKPFVPSFAGEKEAAAATAASSSATAAALDNGGAAPKRNPAANAADGGRIEDGTATVASQAAGDGGTVSAKGLDNPTGQVVGGSIGGTTLNALVGVRVATPFFGTGFNLCVDRWGGGGREARARPTPTPPPSPLDRYFGSFPKVGIVIPNPIAWLLPELIDAGADLKATIDLPLGGKTAPAGAKVSATSDGFVVWLPAIQPTQLGEFGFRYGLQVSRKKGGARVGGRGGEGMASPTRHPPSHLPPGRPTVWCRFRVWPAQIVRAWGGGRGDRREGHASVAATSRPTASTPTPSHQHVHHRLCPRVGRRRRRATPPAPPRRSLGESRETACLGRCGGVGGASFQSTDRRAPRVGPE